MNRGPAAIWVTRPADASQRTVQTLTRAGYAVIGVPVLDVGPVPPDPVPEAPWPDWLVFVSATAVEGLVSATRSTGFPIRAEHATPTRVAVVGQRTAEAALAAGFTVDLTPAHQSAKGLVAAFQGIDIDGARIWVPSGNRRGSAKDDLPEELRRASAAVTSFKVYDTTERQLTASELGRLESAAPGAILFHSPSAADAVFGDHQLDIVRAWREAAPSIAIGETTSRRLAELGARQILTCKEPSDAGVVATLAAIEGLLPRRA